MTLILDIELFSGYNCTTLLTESGEDEIVRKIVRASGFANAMKVAFLVFGMIENAIPYTHEKPLV